MGEEKKHVLCLTHKAMGHIRPMFELADKLAQYHKITFVCCANAISQLPKSDCQQLTIHTMPDDPSYFYAPHKTPSENREGLRKILAGMDQLAQHLTFKGDLEVSSLGIPPVDAVILDNMAGAASLTCMRRGIPFYSLNTGPAYNLSLYVHLLADDIEAIAVDQPATVPGFIPVPGPDGKIRVPIMMTLLYEILLPLKTSMPYSKGVIFSSLRETDDSTLDSIQQQPGMKNVPLYCVGPLIPAEETTKPDDKKVKQCIWLDEKALRSVVYISFGSMMSPRPDQVREIAEAVRSLDRPVIWSIKKLAQNALPEELKSGKFDMQILIVEWAPQKLILAHESVGVFVSHCGWNSTMEGLMSGVPFVAWPLGSDGLIIAQMLLAQQVASHIEGAGLADSRLVAANEIVDRIEEATNMVEEARKFSEILKKAVQRGGSADTDFEGLLSSI